MQTLTQKQSNFVIEYIKNGFNAYQAALSVGYAKNSAIVQSSALVRHPIIAKRIAKAYEVAEKKAINKLAMPIAERSRILSQIIYDIIPKDGSEPKRQYYKDALKAIDMLTKMSGDYAPERRLSMTVDATQKRLNESKKIYEDY